MEALEIKSSVSSSVVLMRWSMDGVVVKEGTFRAVRMQCQCGRLKVCCALQIQVSVRPELMSSYPGVAQSLINARDEINGVLSRQSLKSSFKLVLARVCASTRLTITAQYKLWLPSALGKLPETTTEPAGMRP